MAARDFRPKYDEMGGSQTASEPELEEVDDGEEFPSSRRLSCGALAFAAVVVLLVVATSKSEMSRRSETNAGFLSGHVNKTYQLISDSEDDLALQRYERAASTISEDWRPQMASVKMKDEKSVPKDHIMTLYHQTSPEACQGIIKSDFRLGKGGWCGKGIYFAMSPEETRQKAVTADSGHGCMLELKVDVGRIQRFKSCGRYNKMNLQRLRSFGYDSILFEPPERTGDEVIIFEPKRVREKKIIPFNSTWMAKRWFGKPR